MMRNFPSDTVDLSKEKWRAPDCSCSKCESYECFDTRRIAGSKCTCKNCDYSTCHFCPKYSSQPRFDVRDSKEGTIKIINVNPHASEEKNNNVLNKIYSSKFCPLKQNISVEKNTRLPMVCHTNASAVEKRADNWDKSNASQNKDLSVIEGNSSLRHVFPKDNTIAEVKKKDLSDDIRIKSCLNEGHNQGFPEQGKYKETSMISPKVYGNSEECTQEGTDYTVVETKTCPIKWPKHFSADDDTKHDFSGQKPAFPTSFCQYNKVNTEKEIKDDFAITTTAFSIKCHEKEDEMITDKDNSEQNIITEQTRAKEIFEKNEKIAVTHEHQKDSLDHSNNIDNDFITAKYKAIQKVDQLGVPSHRLLELLLSLAVPTIGCEYTSTCLQEMIKDRIRKINDDGAPFTKEDDKVNQTCPTKLKINSLDDERYFNKKELYRENIFTDTTTGKSEICSTAVNHIIAEDDLGIFKENTKEEIINLERNEFGYQKNSEKLGIAECCEIVLADALVTQTPPKGQAKEYQNIIGTLDDLKLNSPAYEIINETRLSMETDRFFVKENNDLNSDDTLVYKDQHPYKFQNFNEDTTATEKHDDLYLEAIRKKKEVMSLIKECIRTEIKECQYNLEFAGDTMTDSHIINTVINGNIISELQSDSIKKQRHLDKQNESDLEQKGCFYEKIKNNVSKEIREMRESSSTNTSCNDNNHEITELETEPEDDYLIKETSNNKIQPAKNSILRNDSKIISQSESYTSSQNILENKNANEFFCIAPLINNGETLANELTAQVMNLPYKELKQQESKLKSPVDFFKKLKSVYEACSCKICECIYNGPITMTKDTVCDCSYDECKEKETVTAKKRQAEFLDKLLLGQQHICKCKPCECIECKSYQYPASCDCKPCQCIECKSVRTNKATNFIVAPVEQRRPYCQCSPCGCFECAHPYGIVPPAHYTRETGTDERRHMNCNCESCDNDHCEQEGADTCNCERHNKLMKKPVNNDQNQFDIHYCITENQINVNSDRRNRHSIRVNTSLFDQTYREKNVVKRPIYAFDNDVNFVTFSSTSVAYPFTPPDTSQNILRSDSLIGSTSDSCDCKPCECNKCRKHFLEGHIPHRRSKCLCEICDFINYVDLHVSHDKKNKHRKEKILPQAKEGCNCKPCDCKDCKIYMKYINRQKTDSDVNLRNEPVAAIKQNADTVCVMTFLKASDSERFIDLLLTDKESKYRGDSKRAPCSCKKRINDSNDYKMFYANLPKDESRIHNRHSFIKPEKRRVTITENTENILNNKMKIESITYLDGVHEAVDGLNPVTSEHLIRIDSNASSGTNSGRGSDVITTKKQAPTRDSSCNSSGREYSDYLIRFPRSTTVETCNNDVMSLKARYESDISDKKLHSYVTRKSNEKICDKISGENSCDCKPCGCDEPCHYKVPKLKRCRCDCAGCKCDGTCLSEDQSVLIRKNEITQTLKSTFENTDCPCSKDFHSLLKKPSVKFNDSSKIFRCTDVPSHQFQSSLRNNSLKSCTTNISLPIKPIINYDSVRKTIQETKQFSLELLQILLKYEKANKEFDNMTKKFQNLHSSILDSQNFIKKAEDESQKYILEEPFKKGNRFQGDTSENIKETSDKPSRTNINFNKYIEVRNDKKELLDIIRNTETTAKEKTSVASNKSVEKSIKEEPLHSHPIDRTIKTDTGIKDKLDTHKAEFIECSKNFDQTLENSKLKPTESARLDTLKAEFIKNSQHLDKAIEKCKRDIWKKSKKSNAKSNYREIRGNNNTIPVNNSVLEEPTNSTTQLPISIHESLNVDDTLNTVFICKGHRSKQKASVEQTNAKSPNSVPEGKETKVVKNATAKDHCTKDVQSQAGLNRMFQSTPSMYRNNILRHMNESKTVVVTGATSSILTGKSSNDPLKVVLKTVKKLSDHTLLLKWKVPEDISSIEGYELLVGGQPVQKILNPNKNMAVLTCLPHANVVLAIRTIAKSSYGHSPRSTFIAVLPNPLQSPIYRSNLAV